MVDDETVRGPDSQAETGELVPAPRSVRDRAATLAGRSGDRYRLGTPLGHGGMGEVLGATDEQIDREVAIKRMKERNPSQHSMGRFFREACIQGRLDHPAIVPVHELGVDKDGRPFFAMKKLAGTTLSQRIVAGERRQRLLRAFADVCLAIEFAHKRGIVHRDLKPDNIVLGDFGEVYVLDWGVARVLQEPDDEITQRANTIVAERMTVDGTIIGTRAYMAPEQARAERDIDGRADVYSLGCVLFEILTGEQRHPLNVESPEPRPSLRTPLRDIPPELDEVVMAATQHDRKQRTQSPRELADRVERYLDGDRDLALREDLAKQHLQAARIAFAAATDHAGDTAADRRRAMREAGRALALDPKLDGAGELVGRLMIEPPRERPPEMQQMLDADNLDTLRRMSKAAGASYLGFLALVPLAFTGNPELIGYIVALCAIVGLNLWFMLPAWSYRDLDARKLRLVIGGALLIALMARLASPFVIAPAVAVLTVNGLASSPIYRGPRAAVTVAITFGLAVLLPWFGELAGILSPTTHFTETSIVLEPPLVATSIAARHVILGLFVGAVVAAATVIGFKNRKAERIVRERLHLQAWQLRQLVSE